MSSINLIDSGFNPLSYVSSMPADTPKKTIRERVRDLYNKIVPESVQKKFTEAKKICAKVWPAIKSTAQFLKEIIPQLDNILGIFAYAAEALKEFFSFIKDVAASLSEFKIVAILSAPGTVYDFAMSIYKFVRGIQKKIKPKVIADRALGMIDGAIDVTKLVAVFVGNTTFGIVAGFLSTINIVIQGKKLYHSAKFYHVSIKPLKEDANPVTDLDKRDFKDRLDPSDHKEIRTKVNGIWGSELTTLEAKKEITKEFKRRAIQKIACHVLKIISAVITVVATAILLCFPPLAPVAFGLFALSSLISLAEFITDKAVSHHWEKVINKHFDALKPPIIIDIALPILDELDSARV
jgi:hypothetical protein